MRKSLTIAILSMASLTGCLTSAELGKEGDACDAEMLCIAALACVDGICTSLNGTPDAGNNDASNSGTDMSVDPDMGGDMGGDASSEPCDGTCSGDTPTCDETTGTCVACLGDGDCTDGVCVLGATTDDNLCGECEETADCDSGVCDTDSNTCVPCLADGDCTDVDAAKCEQGATTAENACVACDASNQCTGITGSEVCSDGSCVECTDDSDDTRAACNGNSCDPSTNMCTTTSTESLGVCQTCVADSECPQDHRCVPMDFDAQSHGQYCLKVASAGCGAPYVVAVNAASASGAAAEDYCGIRTDRTTCEAILDTGTTCSADTECGADNLVDGICEQIDLSGSDKCTVRCATGDDCPNSLSCTGADQDGNFCE